MSEYSFAETLGRVYAACCFLVIVTVAVAIICG